MEVIVWQPATHWPARLATSWLVPVLLLAVGAAVVELLAMRAAGHVGVPMGVQDTDHSGGMAGFFKGKFFGGLAAGQEHIPPSGQG